MIDHQKLDEASYILNQFGPMGYGRALALVRASNYGATWWMPLSQRSGICDILVFDTIARKDDRLLEYLKDRPQRDDIILRLDCVGGDIGVAVRLGEWLRD